ncbi:conserved hypothetical protein [Pyrenophora tritici-repentis Pt-1C-BFP]|uniref:PD-(D/E)XK nuclease-like domain-containing protein n=1 Tax=Pyrenophora tritici-repentis (strain Pt-1C-BFP) TaxID=426418 RepID=B2WQ69_PYRTR|nr:uncharacterized protein PTRG_12129 [Pyrenophora tritici-repentis Pt-1C-BFP]EDU47322.1 conserved hypothetical protein [Pyrenophora tritici-repentis Pt-1C-BFP]
MPIAPWLCEETIRLHSSSLNAHHDPVLFWVSQAPSPPPSIASHGKLKRSYSKHIATVVMKSIDDATATPPNELEEIVVQLRRIGRGLGVISRSEKIEDAMASMSSDRSFRQIYTDELAFVDDIDRASLGPCPHPREVAKAVSLATECESNEHSEASWNGRVHTYLLDLALYNDVFKGKVGFLDCSKARIEPDSLLPKDYTGLSIESKMVDFAVYLDPDDTTHDALRQLAARDPFTTASWNHTCYPPLQKRPLAMSIETKLTGRDWDTAKIQMSIWVTAQLNKLEQLVAQDGGGLPGLPFLPVIVTQGHEWYFLAATRSKRETLRAEREAWSTYWSKLLARKNSPGWLYAHVPTGPSVSNIALVYEHNVL